MINQEIKLRLVEAFIAQKTPTETIQSEVDKLLEYINKDNPEDVFKIYQVNRESESTTGKLIDREKLNEEMLKIYNETMDSAFEKVQKNDSEEEKLRKIYFDFYDKMEEPERSEAKENFEYLINKRNPLDIGHSISNGFVWSASKQGLHYWWGIHKKYS